MGRPKKNAAEYFSHDNDMRNNRKVKALRSKFGAVGYMAWCMTLEVLCASDDNRLKLTETEIELIAGDFGVSVTEITEIWNFCVKLEMLTDETDAKGCRYIYSEGLNDRLQPVYLKRKRAEEAYKSRLNQQKQPQTSLSVTETTQSKVKESKVKESKEYNNTLHTHAGAETKIEIDPGVEPTDPFLFQSVAEKMAAFFEVNAGQWEKMRHDTGYTGTAYDICLTWASKQDKHTLTRWPQHVGKLTTWMKTEASSKTNHNGTHNNFSGTNGNQQRRPAKTVETALSIRERARRI